MIKNITKWISVNPVKASVIAVAIGGAVFIATNKNAQNMIGLGGTSKPKKRRSVRRRIAAKRLK